MFLNFMEAITALGPDGAFRIANAARPPARYLFATILPEMPKPSYYVDSGTMTVRPTMAGLVGMDSPYPPGGAVEISTFLEQSAKLGVDVTLHEKTLRTIQEMLTQIMMRGGNTKEALASEALNFLNKVVIQALMDNAEWLRGQALVNGEIDWTFNGINLAVDYGVPTANLLTNRTSTAAYDSSASEFWNDWRTAQRLLRYNVRAAIAHPDTINAIVNNDANSAEVLSQTGASGGFTIRKYKTINSLNVPSGDARDVVTLIPYGDEGEILDPTTPGRTISVPFMPTGKILVIGNNNASGYRVGQGSTDDPTDSLALGYTHLAPTVEGGTPGRWARLFTPEGQPWQLRGQGAENVLPVLENPEKVAVMSSNIS